MCPAVPCTTAFDIESAGTSIRTNTGHNVLRALVPPGIAASISCNHMPPQRCCEVQGTGVAATRLSVDQLIRELCLVGVADFTVCKAEEAVRPRLVPD